MHSREPLATMCDRTLPSWEVPFFRCSLRGTPISLLRRLLTLFSCGLVATTSSQLACPAFGSSFPGFPTSAEASISSGSQSLSRSLQKKALSRRAPRGMESITESKDLLHCRLLDLRHLSSSSLCVHFTKQASSKDKLLLVSEAGFQTETQHISQAPLRSISPSLIIGSSPQSPTLSRNLGQKETCPK